MTDKIRLWERDGLGDRLEARVLAKGLNTSFKLTESISPKSRQGAKTRST